MGCGCHCGSIRTIPAAAPVSPQEVVPAADIVAGWDAAVRVDTAGAVSVLPDVSGNGFNLEQVVGANQPTVVVGGGPNGNDSILFDGVNDFMANATLNLPAPGTTPTTYWAVFRQVTWTLTETLWGAGIPGAGRLSLQQNTLTPNILQFNAASGNQSSGLAINIYGIVEAYYSNSASDFILAGGVLASGLNAGNDDPAAGFILGANASLNIFANEELCELWLFRTALTIQQRSQLRAYATSRYGAIP